MKSLETGRLINPLNVREKRISLAHFRHDQYSFLSLQGTCDHPESLKRRHLDRNGVGSARFGSKVREREREKQKEKIKNVPTCQILADRGR